MDEQTVVISELPVGRSTTDYKQFLESCLLNGAPVTAAADSVPGFIKEFKENHTGTLIVVSFVSYVVH